MADNIITAFELILEELEEERNTLSNKITDHATQGQFDEVVKLGQHGNQLEEFRSKVLNLRNEWSRQFATKPVKRTVKKRNRGLRTPQNTYYRPILESLIELNGKARSADVVERVYSKVQHILNDYDRETLDSNPREPRWRDAVSWARYDLREQGFIESGSPQGIWEISAAGRRFIEETTG